MTEAATLGLSLEPLDVLFFRDGKPFDAGIRAASTEPLPLTLAGALRTYVLASAACDFARLGEAVRRGASFAQALAAQSPPLGALADLACRGPWFARGGEPLVPMPATLHRVGKKSADGDFVCLKPLDHAPPGWRVANRRPLWTYEAERTERAAGWLTLDGITAYLAGGRPQPRHVVNRHDLFDIDSRTGIAIGPETWTAEESLIYAADYLALKKEVSFYAEISGPGEALDAAFPRDRPTTLSLGGQGRQVIARRLSRPAHWPVRPAGSARVMLVLTTPGIFAEGWRPHSLNPVAAAVPGYVAFSGWDLARQGPKPTRFAAAAGSVLFFDTPPQTNGLSICDDAEDGQLGWGCYLEGRW